MTPLSTLSTIDTGMEPQQAQGLGYGGPGSTSRIGNRVASMASAARTPDRIPTCETQRPANRSSGAAAMSHLRAGSRRSCLHASSHRQPSSRLPAVGDSPSSADLPSSFEDPNGIPHWQQDALAFDLETGCVPWNYGSDNRPFQWLPWTLFGSKLERKARDPAAYDSIGYNMRPQGPAAGFAGRFLFFFVYCFLLSLCHRKLERLGLHCRAKSPSRPHLDSRADAKNENKNASLAMLWAETLVTTGVCFLLAQGYYGVRAARERMERVRQTIVTLAYSFIKTTTTDSGIGHGRQELQVLIYECLALLTAYPVALLEQMRGNTCEPAITRYCQDTSKALKRLRDGDDTVVASQFYRSEPWVIRGRGHYQFATVEYFFEVFALQLQLEFSRQSMRTKGPSMTSQQIIYNLRNHFENFVDLGNLDDRRTPIIRENIDMLALAGRECSIFSFLDVAPIAFLWSVHLAGWLIAMYCPVQNCDWLVSWTPHEFEDSGSLQFPSLSIMVVMGVLSVLSAMLTTVLSEMWKMWDPFGAGTNTHAWTLGIATEIDNMLNEFYEYDTKGLIRKHAYMDPSAYLNDVGFGACGSSGNKAQTV